MRYIEGILTHDFFTPCSDTRDVMDPTNGGSNDQAEVRPSTSTPMETTIRDLRDVLEWVTRQLTPLTEVPPNNASAAPQGPAVRVGVEGAPTTENVVPQVTTGVAEGTPETEID